jgi:hypothetical protein
MAVPPLNIKDPVAYQLASLIAKHTGKTLTRVVIDALRAEKERVLPRQVDIDKVYEILARIDAMPVRDPRPADEILAGLYDEGGQWK